VQIFRIDSAAGVLADAAAAMLPPLLLPVPGVMQLLLPGIEVSVYRWGD